MGSAASKRQKPSQNKHPSSTAIVAEVVVPGQSQPVKVKGHVDGGIDRTTAVGAAKLTEVAPSTYKVKIGDRDIGTFDAPNSDFESYLKEAASLTITNIETVGGGDDDVDFAPGGSPLHIPLTRQTSGINGVVYSDDEDWENVAESLDRSDTKVSLQSSASKQAAKERRAKIKQAIREKKEKLSQQEYQQMIANHKQEMELMEILREREKERHQLKLGSKVAERKKRREARMAERKEQERLLAENQANSKKGEKSFVPQDDLAVTQEIEAKISKFQRDVESKKEKFSKDEYERLLQQHKEEVSALERKLNHQIGTQKRSFLDKLAERKRKKTAKALTAAELQGLEAELQAKQKQFDDELKEKKGSLSDDEYKRLISQHKMELGEMQEKLGMQRKRQRQEMLDKLAARRKMRGSQNEESLSADEVKELQLALNHRAMAFKDELKDARTKMGSEECQKMIDRHRSEMDKMQNQLDEERDRMREQLMAKLEKRKKRSKGSLEDDREGCFSPEELKQLQVMIDMKNISEKQQITSQKNKVSSKEYRQLLDAHQEKMKEMEKRMAEERELSDRKLRDKLAARRLQRPKSSVDAEEDQRIEMKESSSEDVQTLEREILAREATFQAEVEQKRAKMSEAEYQRLLAQHQKEMDMLRNKLRLSQDKQKQHFKDKLAERRKRRGHVSEGDDETVSSTERLEEEIKEREAAFKATVEERCGEMSDEEYRRLLEEHQRELEMLKEQLKLSQERQRQHFQDKLEERRRRRRGGMISNDEDRMEIISLINNDGSALQEDEIRQIEKEVGNYDNMVKSSIAEKKGKVSKDEVNRLMEEHSRNMEDLNARLAREKQRMLDRLREKRAARKLKLESEADFVNIMATLEKNQRDDLETLSVEELNSLGEDLKKYSQAIQENLENNRGVFPDEELNIMISEHHRNMEAMENRLENERLRMEEKMKRKLEMRNAHVVSTVEEEEEENVRVAEIYHQDVMSSSEDEEDDEIEDLPELGETVANLAATQFWTTPVQSTDLLIVPLAEEYPVKKKRELYTDPSIFRDLDAHAIRLAQTVSLVTQPTFSSLVNELTSIATTELEKARVVFRWITAQNCDEMNLNDVVDDTPLGVLKGLYQKKITFSTLFMRMCRFVGLQCVEITGIAKMKRYTPGLEIDLQDPGYRHTWNAVRIDGYWHFLDCNWGVSHIAGSVTFDPFRFEYDEHYFLADPEVIISSHLPSDSSWQLLRKAVTLDEFNRSVLLKPDFFKYGFGLQDHQQAVILAPQGEIDIRITCPPGFLMSCRLSEAYSGREKSSQGILYDQYEFIHQISDDRMACYVRIPEVGTFHLTLFAKRQFIDGELNVESPTEICRYLVYCRAPSKDTVPLPLSPADHWGPIGVMNAGLVPVSHRSGVIFTQDSEDICIVFKKTMEVSFSHSFTAWGQDETQLWSYVMQRCVRDELIFTVIPPRPDRYGLHIFVLYEGHSNPVHLCSYLIVANTTRPSLEPFPALRPRERWGPTKAFEVLELNPISHLDPFIETDQSIVILEVGHRRPREYTFHFYHKAVELHGDVQMQSSPQQCSFVIDCRCNGYFVLKIFARESHAEDIPFTHVFTYLIHKR